MHVGWPQGIWFGIVALNLLNASVRDGEQKTGKHSLAEMMLNASLGFGLFYWGGFFA